MKSDSDVTDDQSVVGTTKPSAPDKRAASDSNKLDPTGMKLLHPEGMTPFKKEQDILRNLGEVHFIYAEVRQCIEIFILFYYIIVLLFILHQCTFIVEV
jgi:hypothetical protein